MVSLFVMQDEGTCCRLPLGHSRISGMGGRVVFDGKGGAGI